MKPLQRVKISSKPPAPIPIISEDESIQTYRNAITRGVQWFQNSGVFPDPKGTEGVLEGFPSGFDASGRKTPLRNFYLPQMLARRADCTLDTASAFILAGHALNSKEWKIIGQKLFSEGLKEWQYDDASVCRGFFAWYNDPYDRFIFYSDDNGRCILLTLMLGVLEQNVDAIRRGLSGCLALLATHGKNGHRPANVTLGNLYKRGGRAWFRRKKFAQKAYRSPHYEGNAYSALLYGHFLSGDPGLRDAAERGIRDYMTRFPRFVIEMSQNDDFSKLLIASSLLYASTRDPHHQEILQRLVHFFAERQDGSGGIPEYDTFQLRRRKEPTNASYGTKESSVFSSTADRITDQLYSTAFTALGLFLANKSGGCPEARVPLIRLLHYICAIQIHSPNPQLDGGWMRAYSLDLGEYYGANGDVGWGAYAMETGWMISLNILVLSLFILDVNPFTPISPAFKQGIIEAFKFEKAAHESLEREWKIHTPPPPSRPKPPKGA